MNEAAHHDANLTDASATLDASATAHRPWALYWLFGLYGIQQGLLGPAMPFLRAELGLDLRWTGLHFTGYALGLALVGFPYRWLERRTLPVGLGQVGIAAVVFSSGLFALSHSLPVSLLGTVAMGLSGGFVLTVGQARVGARYREHAAARLVEAHIVAGLCVLGGSLLVGGATALGLSWRAAPLIVVGCALLLSLIPCAAYRRDETTGHAPHASHPVDADHARHAPPPVGAARLPRLTQVSLWALVIFGISAEWGVGFWGAEYMKAHLLINASAAATFMSLYFAGTVGGRLASSYVLRRLSPLSLLVSVALGAIATMIALRFTHEIAPTAVLTVILGACLGNFFPLILGSGMRVAPEASSALSAQASQAVGVALLIAPFLLGVLSEGIGMQAAFSLLCVYPVLMLPVMLGLRRASQRGIS